MRSTFHHRVGDIYALLGPPTRPAKTTTLRMVEARMRPDEGTVSGAAMIVRDRSRPSRFTACGSESLDDTYDK